MIDKESDVYALDQQGGKGTANYQINVMCTLCSDSHGTPHAVVYKDMVMEKFKCYGISPYASNAMLSDNPHAGIYEAKTSRTLDLNGGNPACNQGGIVVLAALEGNGTRPSHQGGGYNDGKVMYTLNSTEVHGVVYGTQSVGCTEQTHTHD